MRARWRIALRAAFLAALLAGCGGDDGGGRQLNVMTRNLFLGADLNPALAAQSPTDLVLAASAIFATVARNDFADRAKALAAEIATARPDLVGLQEVALWRTQTPGDAALGGTTPATDVAFDFLALLQAELQARGLTYSAVEVLALTDVEVPIIDGRDVRFTDRDVILARQGVATSNPQGQVYSTLLQVSAPGVGLSLAIQRGFTRVHATVGGQPITFVNTHLEAESGAIRTAQAEELMQALAPDAGRVVLVGDLNSVPGTEGHLAATTAGFSDAWTALHPAEPGLTCCFAEDLSLTPTALSTRIDLVLTRGALQPVSAAVVGEDPAADRSPGGRWPSDHAGVVASIDVK
jgi:endonuclease/exonuclease/phosphatase family metal-dependent hydrolase